MSLEFQIRGLVICILLLIEFACYPLANMLLVKWRKKESNSIDNCLVASIMTFAIALAAYYALEYYTMMR